VLITPRYPIAVGLFILAVGLAWFGHRTWSSYMQVRKQYFDPSTASITQIGFDFPRGLESLESREVHFVYQAVGIVAKQGQFLNAAVTSADFDIYPLHVVDFPATQPRIDLIWQVKPHDYGLKHLGLTLQAYHLDQRSGRQVYDQNSSFRYHEVYVDPRPWSLRWILVHLGTAVPLVAAVLSFLGAILTIPFAEALKAYFGLNSK
jgi:hypothetical protein